MTIRSIIIGSAEPDWVKRLAWSGITKTVSPTNVSLLISCNDSILLTIERKSITDFLADLRAGILFDRLAEMKKTNSRAYLALVGELRPGQKGRAIANGVETGWNWSSIQTAYLTVQELGVCIIHVPTDNDFEGAILRLGNRDHQPLQIKPTRETTSTPTQEIFLNSLPGINAKRAHDLIECCGTPAWALFWLTDDRRLNNGEIAGLGIEAKRKIRQALGLTDNQVLAIWHKELPAWQEPNMHEVEPPQPRQLTLDAAG